MNGAEAMRASFAGAHNWYNGTVADVTEEQSKSLPPGVVHPIGELAAHILNTEDSMIAMAKAQPTIWESEGWGAKLGIDTMFMHGGSNEVARATRVNVADLAEYGQKVFANTDAYLASLTDADLDREIEVLGSKMKAGDFLGGILLGNTYAHVGEISALKGLHGAKGYPF